MEKTAHVKYKLGFYIKRERESRSIKQDEVAGCIGVSRQTLSSMENDRHEMGMQDFLRLCDALNIRPSQFFGSIEHALNSKWRAK